MTHSFLTRRSSDLFPPQSQEKVAVAYKSALEGLDHMRTAGVKVGFGTDLLGETYVQQCREFSIRREVFSPIEILRQATSIAAEILMQDGKLGCIAPGAYADLDRKSTRLNSSP